MKKTLILLLLFLPLSISADEKEVEQKAASFKKENFEKRIDIKGHFRWRHRTANNTGYKSAFTNFNDLRFRAGANIKANHFTNVYLEGHLDKNIGGYGGFSGDSGATGLATSGTGKDDLFGIHQAFAKINPNESFQFVLGRQILNYGDQLIISPLEWDNTGRVFDALKATYTYGFGEIDLFYSILAQGASVTTNTREDDDEFSGLYSSMDLGAYAKNIDFYVLHRIQKSLASRPELSVLGFRAKSKMRNFDYRFEATVQNEKKSALNSKGGWQVNPEIGYTFGWKKLRLAFQYFVANENYIQLYPLGHGFLGYADMFGRRNIKGQAFHLKFSPTEKLVFTTEFHLLKRRVITADAYKVNGSSAYSSSSSSDDLGSEIDVTLIWKMAKGNKLVTGLAQFMPGDYIKGTGINGSKSYSLGYLMYILKF